MKCCSENMAARDVWRFRVHECSRCGSVLYARK